MLPVHLAQKDRNTLPSSRCPNKLVLCTTSVFIGALGTLALIALYRSPKFVRRPNLEKIIVSSIPAALGVVISIGIFCKNSKTNDLADTIHNSNTQTHTKVTNPALIDERISLEIFKLGYQEFRNNSADKYDSTFMTNDNVTIDTYMEQNSIRTVRGKNEKNVCVNLEITMIYLEFHCENGEVKNFSLWKNENGQNFINLLNKIARKKCNKDFFALVPSK